MLYQLRKNVYVCAVARRSVFLDVTQDRYFCTSTASEQIFSKVQRGAEISDEESLILTSLIKKSLIIPKNSHENGSCASQFHSCDLEKGSLNLPLENRLSYVKKSIASAFYYIIKAELSLKLMPLDLILCDVRKRKLKIIKAHRNNIKEICSAFRWAERIFPARNRCLSQSLALIDNLIANGYAPDLIFGVTLEPFSAHCWIQIDSLILNDDYENLRKFTPILSI